MYSGDVEYAILILRAERNVELKDIFLDTVYVSAHKGMISPKTAGTIRPIRYGARSTPCLSPGASEVTLGAPFVLNQDHETLRCLSTPSQFLAEDQQAPG
jgi:hypothetical protein